MKNIHKRRLHFVGIGGIGMSGIAEVFLRRGFEVSGSDLHESKSVEALRSLGAKVTIGHKSESVEGKDVVVISSAVRSDNPEVVKARELRIPVIPRAEMLGEIMRGKRAIAVAGSHGKTSTTSMLGSVLTDADLDPTLVIGGIVNSIGSNARIGDGEIVLVEADESDGSFLHLPATYEIVTNIDNDHLDHFQSLERLDEAFVEFVNKIPFYGMAVLCGDDPGVKRILRKLHKPYLTYGTGIHCDYQARSIQFKNEDTYFDVVRKNPGDNSEQLLGTLKIHQMGMHNVLNSLGVIALAIEMGVPLEAIQKGLSSFRGVRRRFDIVWRSNDNTQVIVDDYGHHPTEIKATLDTAKRYWKGRIITVFQPHRYSRTLSCFDQFPESFQKSDVVLLCDIYPAGEDAIAGVTSEALHQKLLGFAGGCKDVRYVGGLSGARDEILKIFGKNDLVLCLGAGSITQLPSHLIPAIQVASSA